MLHIPRGSFIDENKVQTQTIKSNLGLTMLLRVPLAILNNFIAVRIFG